DEVGREVVVTVEDGDAERILPIRGLRVQIGARLDQYLRGVDVTFTRGEHQRREFAGGELDEAGLLRPTRARRETFESAAGVRRNEYRAGIRICAMLDEHFGHFR